MIKNIALISCLLIVCVNTFSQDRFLDVIKNIPCTQRRIDTTNFINISNTELPLSEINQDFIYENQAYILLNSTDKYSLFCPFSFEHLSDSTGKLKLSGFSMKYMFIDKVQRRCFDIRYIEQTESLNQLENDFYTVCNMNINGSINSIRELSTNKPYNIKMILNLIQSTHVGADFPKIGDFHGLTTYPKQGCDGNTLLFSDIYTYNYNIYDISLKDFMGLYDKFNKISN